MVAVYNFKIEKNICLIILSTGRDVFHVGLATHFCDSSQIGDLEAALVKCANSSEVEKTLNFFCPVDSTATFSLLPQMNNINKCFNGASMEEILENLEYEDSDWARGILKVNICLMV